MEPGVTGRAEGIPAHPVVGLQLRRAQDAPPAPIGAAIEEGRGTTFPETAAAGHVAVAVASHGVEVDGRRNGCEPGCIEVDAEKGGDPGDLAR